MTLLDAMHWLACEFSCSRDELLRAHGPAAADALVSHGYAREQDGRYALTDTGLRKLKAERPEA